MEAKLPRRRIPIVPRHWGHFAAAFFLHLAFPLIPLLLEAIALGHVNPGTWTIIASMYAMSIGVSSRELFLWVISIVVSVLFAALHGVEITASVAPPYIPWVSGGAIVLILIYHAVERYNRHVVDRTPFWEFMTEGVK